MSYSVCINCEQMVPAYEKYCRACLKKYPGLRQVLDFWQHHPGTTPPTWTTAKQMAQEEIAALER